jgi:hypothetical protein
VFNLFNVSHTLAHLPTGLADPRDQPLIGKVSEANPADAKLAINTAGPTTHLATALSANGEFRIPQRFCDFRFFCHVNLVY